LALLASEPLQKWNEINWVQREDLIANYDMMLDQALDQARVNRKPIFLELIVGRYGEKESKVC